jgi:hypothetical protein
MLCNLCGGGNAVFWTIGRCFRSQANVGRLDQLVDIICSNVWHGPERLPRINEVIGKAAQGR